MADFFTRLARRLQGLEDGLVAPAVMARSAAPAAEEAGPHTRRLPPPYAPPPGGGPEATASGRRLLEAMRESAAPGLGTPARPPAGVPADSQPGRSEGVEPAEAGVGADHPRDAREVVFGAETEAAVGSLPSPDRSQPEIGTDQGPATVDGHLHGEAEPPRDLADGAPADPVRPPEEAAGRPVAQPAGRLGREDGSAVTAPAASRAGSVPQPAAGRGDEAEAHEPSPAPAPPAAAARPSRPEGTKGQDPGTPGGEDVLGRSGESGAQPEETGGQGSDAGRVASASGREARAPEARAPEARAPEARAPEARAPEARAPEARAPEARAPEARAPEARAPEARAPEARAPEARAPEARAPEARAPEARAPEARAPEARAPEARAPEAPMLPTQAAAAGPTRAAADALGGDVPQAERPAPGDPAGPPGDPAGPPGDPAGPPGDPAGPPGDPAGPPGDPAGPPGDPAGPPGDPAGPPGVVPAAPSATFRLGRDPGRAEAPGSRGEQEEYRAAGGRLPAVEAAAAVAAAPGEAGHEPVTVPGPARGSLKPRREGLSEGVSPEAAGRGAAPPEAAAARSAAQAAINPEATCPGAGLPEQAAAAGAGSPGVAPPGTAPPEAATWGPRPTGAAPGEAGDMSGTGPGLMAPSAGPSAAVAGVPAGGGPGDVTGPFPNSRGRPKETAPAPHPTRSGDATPRPEETATGGPDGLRRQALWQASDAQPMVAAHNAGDSPVTGRSGQAARSAAEADGPASTLPVQNVPVARAPVNLPARAHGPAPVGASPPVGPRSPEAPPRLDVPPRAAIGAAAATASGELPGHQIRPPSATGLPSRVPRDPAVRSFPGAKDEAQSAPGATAAAPWPQDAAPERTPLRSPVWWEAAFPAAACAWRSVGGRRAQASAAGSGPAPAGSAPAVRVVIGRVELVETSPGRNVLAQPRLSLADYLRERGGR
jgi:hypothetical protein